MKNIKYLFPILIFGSVLQGQELSIESFMSDTLCIPSDGIVHQNEFPVTLCRVRNFNVAKDNSLDLTFDVTNCLTYEKQHVVFSHSSNAERIYVLGNRRELLIWGMNDNIFRVTRYSGKSPVELEFLRPDAKPEFEFNVVDNLSGQQAASKLKFSFDTQKKMSFYNMQCKGRCHQGPIIFIGGYVSICGNVYIDKHEPDEKVFVRVYEQSNPNFNIQEGTFPITPETAFNLNFIANKEGSHKLVVEARRQNGEICKYIVPLIVCDIFEGKTSRPHNSREKEPFSVEILPVDFMMIPKSKSECQWFLRDKKLFLCLVKNYAFSNNREIDLNDKTNFLISYKNETPRVFSEDSTPIKVKIWEPDNYFFSYVMYNASEKDVENNPKIHAHIHMKDNLSGVASESDLSFRVSPESAAPHFTFPCILESCTSENIMSLQFFSYPAFMAGIPLQMGGLIERDYEGLEKLEVSLSVKDRPDISPVFIDLFSEKNAIDEERFVDKRAFKFGFIFSEPGKHIFVLKGYNKQTKETFSYEIPVYFYSLEEVMGLLKK